MWKIGDVELSSRFLIGTAKYPSFTVMENAIKASAAEVITVSLKREVGAITSDHLFWEFVRNKSYHLLPNTAGCHRADEAINLAEIARELFETNWVKLEVIGDDYTLQPNVFELVKAAEELIKRGFEVFPYCTDDLVVCQRLLDAGCNILMPLAAPIGTGKGIINPYALQTLRNRFPHVTLIIDAGIGKPSHVACAMEMGFDAVLLNTAVATALHPVVMAGAFRDAVIAGRAAFEAGMMPERDLAHASTLLIDTPFWHQSETL